ncbi:hypothetical protein BCAH1134_C0684 (plasmid) [Bacillus cereus AH1134]|nr:hypothetical protein BCAH1134_C0684 [Bacillus cereus AH1134]
MLFLYKKNPYTMCREQKMYYNYIYKFFTNINMEKESDKL